jgi:hypothetical protein
MAIWILSQSTESQIQSWKQKKVHSTSPYQLDEEAVDKVASSMLLRKGDQNLLHCIPC